MQVEKTHCIKWLFKILATGAFPQQVCWPDAAWYHMSQLLQCLFAETEMAAIANTSDSCHEAELDASCLLSDNYVSSRFMETCWLLLWLLMHFQTDIYHLLLRHGSSKSFMWLWKWPTSSLYITTGREGGIGRRGGPDPTHVLSLLSLPSIFLCPPVRSSCLSSSDVRWWCAVVWARD